jgi:hypothetical protein
MCCQPVALIIQLSFFLIDDFADFSKLAHDPCNLSDLFGHADARVLLAPINLFLNPLINISLIFLLLLFPLVIPVNFGDRLIDQLAKNIGDVTEKVDAVDQDLKVGHRVAVLS